MKSLAYWMFCLVLYGLTVMGARAQSFPDVVYVATGGTGNGSSWGNALDSIQAGVNAANPNGTVLVSNGVYTLAFAIAVADGKTVRGFHGTNDPARETVVDGNAATRCFSVNNGTVDGLVIRNGRAAYAAGIDLNGGTVMHCRVEGNIATNSAANFGGAGIRLNGVCMVSNCAVIRNQIQYNAAGGNQYGGSALHLRDATYLVKDCVIAGNANNLQLNTAVGTVFINGGSGDFVNCDMMRNTNYAAVDKVVMMQSLAGNARFQHCFIISNNFPDMPANATGNALYLINNASASHCIVADNVNSRGVWMEGNAMLFGTTVRGHMNVASDGAGICMAAASACVVDDCTIETNSIAATVSNRRGAGVFLRGGVIRNSRIRGNQTGASVARGAGIMIRGAPSVISNCWIMDNKSMGGGAGGGVAVWEDATSPDTLITHSVITGNAVEGEGGGVHNDGASRVIIRNSLLAGNNAALNGGGIRAGNTVVESCTVASNMVVNPSYRGGGLYSADANNRIINTIIFNNKASIVNASNWFNVVSGAVYSNCCTMPTAALPGGGNIEANPLFADPGAGDYRLQFGSPCINAGLNQMDWMPGAMDLDGRPRLDRFSRIVDVGCYEYLSQGTLYHVR